MRRLKVPCVCVCAIRKWAKLPLGRSDTTIGHIPLRTHQNPPEPQPFGQGQEDEKVGGVGDRPPPPLPQPVGVDAEAAGQGIPGLISLV